MSKVQVINNLERIKKSIENNDINYLFIDYSLNWIMKEANRNLNKSTNGYLSSDARNWNTKIYGTFGILENLDMNSASIEFGIGVVGKNNPKNIDITNANISFEYDVPSEYKNEDGSWTFYEPKTNTYIKFKGYVGKSFLYKSTIKYIQLKKYITFYQRAFDRVMRRVIR